jgi:hypothetical protein
MAKAIWYPLAKAFRTQITEVSNVLVFQVKCAGDNYKSAAIRTWETDPDFQRLLELTPEWEREALEAEGDHRIRDTIVFKADEIVCSNVTEGHFHIDLAFPLAQEVLLHWMKRCRLVQQEATFTGALRPWKDHSK